MVMKMTILPLAGLEIMGKQTIDDGHFRKNSEEVIVTGGWILGIGRVRDVGTNILVRAGHIIIRL